jgi:adenylylsulfate kinase
MTDPRTEASIAPHRGTVSAPRGVVVWLTGLSGAGKSTIADALAARLRSLGRNVEVLDGDVVRTHLSKGLGFSKEDRDTNVRRIGFVAHLLARNGVVAITAAISPYRATRAWCRETARGDFLEVYVNAPLESCEARDVKGLYKKARAGEIPAFTGVSDPYEPPDAPELEVRTDRVTVEQGVEDVLAALRTRGYLRAHEDA